MMKNSSHRDEYPAMQSNGPLPQVLFVHIFIGNSLPYLEYLGEYLSEYLGVNLSANSKYFISLHMDAESIVTQ